MRGLCSLCLLSITASYSSSVIPLGPTHECYDNEPNSAAYRLRVGAYNTTICNRTAWTFRTLMFGQSELLSPTGFTQTVSNLNIAPNTSPQLWPPLQPVSEACPVILQGPNGGYTLVWMKPHL